MIRNSIAAGISAAELAGSPYEVLAKLRSQVPVVWLPAIDGWLVTSHQLVAEAMRDARTFTVDHPRFSTAQVVGTTMLSLDGAEHQRHRTPFVASFRSGVVVLDFKDWLADECAARVKRFGLSGKAELRTGMAGPLAVATICRALGLANVEQSELLGWYRLIVAAVSDITAGREPDQSGPMAAAELKEAVLLTIRSSHESWLSQLVGSTDLTESEIAANTVVLLFGAIETSEGATANAFFHILTNPGWVETLRDEPELVPNAVEESLRLEPAASVVDRYTTEDCVLGGQRIPKGHLVRLSLLGANRDPTKFADPDTFNPRRANGAQHLTFAQGPHSCLGLHLAKLQTVEAVRAVLNGLRQIRLVPGETDQPNGLVFRKPDRVTVRF